MNIMKVEVVIVNKGGLSYLYEYNDNSVSSLVKFYSDRLNDGEKLTVTRELANNSPMKLTIQIDTVTEEKE